MNGFQLKLLAVILMIIDHIGYFFPDTIPIWFRFIGRLSMPIFIFVLVEGYIHTRDIKKYITRIASLGTIMFFMNIIISIIGVMIGIDSKLSPLLPNIFITMAFCLLTLHFINKIRTESSKIGIYKNPRDKSIIYIALLIFVLIISLFVEYSLIPVGLTIIFYKFRGNKRQLIIAYIVGSFILSTIFSNWVQYFMIFSIIPIYLYNGKKGYTNKFWKYFFYLFYPAHIYLLYLIR